MNAEVVAIIADEVCDFWMDKGPTAKAKATMLAERIAARLGIQPAVVHDAAPHWRIAALESDGETR